MDKKTELKLFFLGIVLVLLLAGIIYAIKFKIINPKASPAHPASFSIAPAFGNYEIGKIYQANVILEGRQIESSGAKAVIRFDPNLVEIIDEDPNIEGIQVRSEALFPDTFENFADPEQGLIRIAASKKKGGSPVTINFPAPFASFHFKPKAEGKINFQFDFEKNQTGDSNVFEDLGKRGNQDVLNEVANAEYNIAKGF